MDINEGRENKNMKDTLKRNFTCCHKLDLSLLNFFFFQKMTVPFTYFTARVVICQRVKNEVFLNILLILLNRVNYIS